MADGDAQYAAAILSRMHKNEEAMKSLFSAVESSLADLADPVRLQGMERLMGALESALADLVAGVSGDGTSKAIDRLAVAVAGMKAPQVTVQPAAVTVHTPESKAPVVNVQVQPTPITVEAVMPAPVINFTPPAPAPDKGRKWKVTYPTQYGNREMTIERMD